MVSDWRLKAILDDLLVHGHFLLSSGFHSDCYNETARLSQSPMQCSEVGAALVELVGDVEYDTVVAPALGGLVLGFEVARQAKTGFVFCERDSAGELVISRSQSIRGGGRILVVDNVLTTGRTLSEVRKCVAQMGGDSVAAAFVVRRSDESGKPDRQFIVRSLLVKQLPMYAADACPLCAAGVALEVKGSRPGRRKGI